MIFVIYRCTNHECSYIAEWEEIEEKECPNCGASLEEMTKETLSAIDWGNLGNFWMEEDSKNEKRICYCYGRASQLGSARGMSNFGWCLEHGWMVFGTWIWM